MVKRSLEEKCEQRRREKKKEREEDRREREKKMHREKSEIASEVDGVTQAEPTRTDTCSERKGGKDKSKRRRCTQSPETNLIV